MIFNRIQVGFVKEFLESSYISCKSRSRDQLHWHNTQVGRLQHTSVKNCLNLATSIKKKKSFLMMTPQEENSFRLLLPVRRPCFFSPPNACFFLLQVFINLFSLLLLSSAYFWGWSGTRSRATEVLWPVKKKKKTFLLKNWNHKKVVIKWKWGGLSRKESTPVTTGG